MSSRVGYGQRRLRVTPEVIEALFVNDRRRILTDLPDDARFVSLWRTDAGDSYMLLFESSEWDELSEGEVIPQIHIKAETVEADDA